MMELPKMIQIYGQIDKSLRLVPHCLRDRGLASIGLGFSQIIYN